MISVSGLLQKWQDRIMTELAGVDEACQIKWSTTSADKIMSSFDQRIWLLSLNAAPHGVWLQTPEPVRLKRPTISARSTCNPTREPVPSWSALRSKAHAMP